MTPDFYAGYLSGAAGILIGNPLDVIKVRLQAAPSPSPSPRSSSATSSPSHLFLLGAAGIAPTSKKLTSLLRGSATPLLTYGALNALLYVSYNRALQRLDGSSPSLSSPLPHENGIIDTDIQAYASLPAVFAAGVIGGLASWVISAPTELVKCRVQVHNDVVSSREYRGGGGSSWTIAREVWRQKGPRGFYLGGGVTSVRDGVGYGFYFWSYELSKRYLNTGEEDGQEASWKVLLCGGIAGVVTWASVFPLDVVKTRMQTQGIRGEGQGLLGGSDTKKGSWGVAKEAYRQEGWKVFFRGLGVCSSRAFLVNAVQWAVYEWTMRALRAEQSPQNSSDT